MKFDIMVVFLPNDYKLIYTCTYEYMMKKLLKAKEIFIIMYNYIMFYVASNNKKSNKNKRHKKIQNTMRLNFFGKFCKKKQQQNIETSANKRKTITLLNAKFSQIKKQKCKLTCCRNKKTEQDQLHGCYKLVNRFVLIYQLFFIQLYIRKRIQFMYNT